MSETKTVSLHAGWPCVQLSVCKTPEIGQAFGMLAMFGHL
jgi:hypothetical protein